MIQMDVLSVSMTISNLTPAIFLISGLLTVYLINAVMAFLALGKASERGQSSFLWAMKTFSVGGIAYDQLTQLPTLEAIKKAKGQKGKRALKNRK